MELPPYQVTYLVEADVLIFCALQRKRNGCRQIQQLFRLMAVLRMFPGATLVSQCPDANDR